MFGLFQGGIVPSYAIIVREAMPAREAATRVGIVILASVFGMSFGGWVSGVIFDATGSYAAAFLNGLGWNALNITIMVLLLIRRAAAAGDGVTRRLHRLARLQQRAAGDFQAAVRLVLQRVERLPGLAIGVDDVDALGDPAARHAGLAELEALVAVDRRVASLHHPQEEIGLREYARWISGAA